MISNHVSMKAFPASHHEYTFKFVYERSLDSITSHWMDKSEMAYNPNLMDGGSDGGHGNLPSSPCRTPTIPCRIINNKCIFFVLLHSMHASGNTQIFMTSLYCGIN